MSQNRCGDLSPIALAASTGKLDMVKQLASTAGAPGCLLEPLFAATEADQLEVVQWCLEQGVDVNQYNQDGFNPLVVAAHHSSLEILAALVQAGADIDQGVYGTEHVVHNALMVGIMNQRKDVVQFLLEKGARRDGCEGVEVTSLNKAAQLGHLDMVKQLLDLGASIDMCTPSGFTAVFAAAKNGQLDMVKYLIEQGARPAKVPNSCFSLIGAAAVGNQPGILRWVITESGINEEIVIETARVALSAAAQHGHLEAAKCLLDICPWMDSVAKGVALCTAIKSGCLDMVLLLEREGVKFPETLLVC